MLVRPVLDRAAISLGNFNARDLLFQYQLVILGDVAKICLRQPNFSGCVTLCNLMAAE